MHQHRGGEPSVEDVLRVGGAIGVGSNRSAQKSSNRRITEATRSFSCERFDPAHSTTSGLIPRELEDVGHHALVLAGGDHEWLVVLTFGKRRMMGTSLIASGRVPTMIGTTSFEACSG